MTSMGEEEVNPSGRSAAADVLVVDDDPAIRDLLAEALAARGYRVDRAEGATQAMERLGDRDYDVLVVALRMPGVDGRELFRILRDRRPELAERVVFMTGDTANRDTVDFLTSVERPVLLKPFDLDTLYRAISAQTGQRRPTEPS